MCTGYEDLRPAGRILHFDHIKFNAFRRFEHLSFDLLILCQHGIRPSEIDADILAYIALYNTCNDVFLFLKILVEYDFSLPP